MCRVFTTAEIVMHNLRTNNVWFKLYSELTFDVRLKPTN